LAKARADSSIQYACPSCGQAISEATKYCGACGASIVRSSASSGETGTATPGPGAAPAAWKSALTMMFNPGVVLKKSMAGVPPQFALAISGLAFGLFFLQTGLDMARGGHGGVSQIISTTIAGAIFGSIGIALISLVAWVFSLPFGAKRSVGWSMRAFALGYSPALVYAVVGIIFNVVLGWNTAVAFGVTGALWAMGPMLATVREMLDGRIGPSVALCTVCGGLVLFGWSFLGTRDLPALLSIVMARP